MDTRKTVMLGIKRGGLLALLLGFAFWPSLTGGRTKPTAPDEAPARFQRAPAQPDGHFELSALAVMENELFAAAGGNCGDGEGAGVFRSSNEGQSWTPLDDGPMSMSVRSLMVGNSGALFAGTRDGVFRSTNFGNTWTPTGLRGVDISTMTSGPEVLFAGDGCLCSGVYRSTDEGDSWQKVNEGLAACVRGLAIDQQGAVFAATADHGVYRSTDNGDSWTPANAGLTTFGLKTVAVDGEGHVFVGSASDGVFRSTDGGASWAHVGLSGLRVNTIATQAGSDILAGTDSAVYRSTDDGYTWDAVDLGLSEPAEVRALALGEHGMAFAAAGRHVLRTSLAARAGSGGGAVPSSLLAISAPTVDAVASASGNAVTSLTWNHTVGNADPNRMLIVGVSIKGNKTATAVTYNGVALTRQGFLGNGNNNRVEIWSLLAPAAGTPPAPAPVVVTLSASTAAVAGSISFYGVDQATPLGAFASASGNSTIPSMFVTTQNGAIVVDTLAANGDAGTATAAQAQQWNVTTGAATTNVIGAGSTKAATTTSLTMSWTLTAAKAWTLGAIPVNGVGVLPPCVLPYPFPEPNFPRSNVVFSENPILRGVQGPPGCTFGQPSAVIAYYNDEHAITLGVRQVVIISAKTCSTDGSPCANIGARCGVKPNQGVCTGTGSTTNYPVSPLTSNPGHAFLSGVVPPPIGTTDTTGDQAGLDVNTCVDTAHPGLSCGRPMWPSLFVTDITNDPTSRAGDWQHYGIPNGPSEIFGTWKAAVRIVDKTVPPTSANAVSVVADADPVRNNWNLGFGETAPPGLVNEGYGAEIRWNLNELIDNNGQKLVTNKRYYLQVIIHDGDQNKVGGDIGEGCAIATFDEQCFFTPTPTPTPTPTVAGPTDTPTPTPTDTPTPPPITPTTTPTPGGADLSIVKTGSPTSICINSVTGEADVCVPNSRTCGGTTTPITYTIDVTNNGPADATSVVVTDVLPQFTSFVSCVTSPVVTCTNNAGTVTATFPTLGSGSPPQNQARVTIVVNVDGTAILDFELIPGNLVTQISNTATVSSQTSDPDSNNNGSTANTVVVHCNPPDLRRRLNEK